jgi:hypothetical protein
VIKGGKATGVVQDGLGVGALSETLSYCVVPPTRAFPSCPQCLANLLRATGEIETDMSLSAGAAGVLNADFIECVVFIKRADFIECSGRIERAERGWTHRLRVRGLVEHMVAGLAHKSVFGGRRIKLPCRVPTPYLNKTFIDPR